VSLPELIAVRGRSAAVGAWLEQRARVQRVTLLTGPRGLDPRRFGIPQEASDWFIDSEGSPDPGSFGLCLAALERVLLDRSPGTWLVGDGQGAALVLALACCWAERLAGVIAIDGALPDLPEGALDEAPMDGLPIFLIGDTRESAARLAVRGARVTALASFEPESWPPHGSTLRVSRPERSSIPGTRSVG
jgi:pimeloyl-ACP methyl ester carboxylesterase